jgi:hypothetical protein
MPVPSGTRFRFKGSGKHRVRLAIHSGKVIEVVPWPKGGKKKRAIHPK